MEQMTYMVLAVSAMWLAPITAIFGVVKFGPGGLLLGIIFMGIGVWFWLQVDKTFKAAVLFVMSCMLLFSLRYINLHG